MKKTLTLAIATIFALTATAKTFVANGNGRWTDASIWNEVPGATIQAGDEVIIKGNVVMNVAVTVEGLLVIDNNATITGSKDLTIAKSGQFENNGSMITKRIVNNGVILNNKVMETVFNIENSGSIINNSAVLAGQNLVNNSGNIAGTNGSYIVNKEVKTQYGEFGNNIKVLVGGNETASAAGTQPTSSAE